MKFDATIVYGDDNYNLKNYAEFLNTLRSISLVDGICFVKIKLETAESPWIRLNLSDFYITGIGENIDMMRDFPKDLLGYKDEHEHPNAFFGKNAITKITYEAIVGAFHNASNWLNDKVKALTNKTVKLLAFIISEAVEAEAI